MATPLQTFKSKLGIGTPKMKGVGYNFTPTILQQGQSQSDIGQAFADKVTGRKDAGANLYNTGKQENTNRLATDLVNKSAGLKFDEFGRPELNLANFAEAGKTTVDNIGERGNLALQTEQAKQTFKNAVTMQDLGQYGFSGYAGGTSGTSVPGASSDNKGAQAAAKAMQVMRNGTNYVWGGNSLVNGVDCSGLVQQIYSQLGVKIPRTTYEQAKNGKKVSINDIRPGDLVFYNKFGHVGIYVGNGKIVHAANSKLGVIQSNLTNSNGSPLLVLRPY